MIFADTASRVL